MKKKSLGRGLDALLGDNQSVSDGVQSVRVSQIFPNRRQPRRSFDPNGLQELADSIREHGVLQPIVVREEGAGYTIIAGERRWRAARLAGLTEIPAIVRECGPQEAAQLSLIENLQRAGLNPIEEACGYSALMSEYGLSQDQVAEGIGKPRSTIANALRLLSLPEDVRKLITDGKLSGGHGKVLAGIEDAGEASRLAQTAAESGWSVRELEKAVKSTKKQPKKPSAAAGRDSFYQEFEIAVTGSLGRKVRIGTLPRGKRPGRMELEFYSKEDLADIARLLCPEE